MFIKEVRHSEKIRARKRFRREVTSYEMLVHPGLPTLIEHNGESLEEKSTGLYLVLECIPGDDLATWIAAHGPMPLDLAVTCTTRILEVVAYCHGEFVIHRDIKPGNVMLRNADPADPVVVDFGLSFMDAPDESEELTDLNETIGNRFLRLPEAWSNPKFPL